MMECVSYVENRKTLFDKIERIYMLNNVPYQNREMTFSNLLVPKHDSKTNAEITAATADFIMSSSIII